MNDRTHRSGRRPAPRPGGRTNALGAAAGLVAGILAGAPPATAQMIYTQLPESGDTYVNACQRTPLHAEPSAYSKVVGTAEVGDELTVAKLTGEYLLPKSMRESGHDRTPEIGRKAEKKQHDPENFFPAWAKVETQSGDAYLTMRCLVSPGFFEEQNAEDAARKFKSAKMAEGGKGFNLKPASGGSGKGLSGQLAAYGEDRDAVKALLETNVDDPYRAFKDFRKAGGVGEFAPELDKPKLHKRPARDVERAPDKSFGEAMDDAGEELDDIF